MRVLTLDRRDPAKSTQIPSGRRRDDPKPPPKIAVRVPYEMYEQRP